MDHLIYRLRYKICRRLLPKKLAVYMYDGAEYTTIYDEETMRTWGYVRVEMARAVFRCTLTETGNDHRVDYDHTQPCNAQNDQSSEK